MILTADRFIYDTLTGDATLAGMVGTRIYSEVAPHNMDSPWVVYQCQTPEGRSVNGLGAVQIMLDEIYTVRVIREGNSYDPIEDAADRMIELLHGKHGAVSGGYALACVMTGPVKYMTLENGKPYRHLGAMFRIYSQ
jgi:hypothetical protein